MTQRTKFYDTLDKVWVTDWMAMNDGRIVADSEGKELCEVLVPERYISCTVIGALDSNGVELYEGCIVEVKQVHPIWRELTNIGSIVYNIRSGAFVVKNPTGAEFLIADLVDSECKITAIFPELGPVKNPYSIRYMSATVDRLKG